MLNPVDGMKFREMRPMGDTITVYLVNRSVFICWMRIQMIFSRIKEFRKETDLVIDLWNNWKKTVLENDSSEKRDLPLLTLLILQKKGAHVF